MTPKQRITSKDLINYRVSLLEEGQLKHEDRIRLLEDFVTRENAGGLSMKQLIVVIVGLASLGAAFYEVAKNL